MRLILLLLLASALFVLLQSGVVLNLMIIIIKVHGSIAVTEEMLFWLYALAALIVVGLLWLFVRIGAVK